MAKRAIENEPSPRQALAAEGVPVAGVDCAVGIEHADAVNGQVYFFYSADGKGRPKGCLNNFFNLGPRVFF